MLFVLWLPWQREIQDNNKNGTMRSAIKFEEKSPNLSEIGQKM